MTDTSRQEFEAFARTKTIYLAKHTGTDVYCDSVTNYVWLGWQASRSADQVPAVEPVVAYGVMETTQFGNKVWFDFMQGLNLAFQVAGDEQRKFGGKYEVVSLFTRPMPQEQAVLELIAALDEIISLNRTHCREKYGDSSLAETMGCVLVARAAIEKVKRITK